MTLQGILLEGVGVWTLTDLCGGWSVMTIPTATSKKISSTFFSKERYCFVESNKC